MDRRLILAFVLMLIVAIVPPMLFPPERGGVPEPDPIPAVIPPDTAEVELAPQRPAEGAATRDPAPDPVEGPAEEVAAADVSPVHVESSLYRFIFDPTGARLTGAIMKRYRSLAPNDSGRVNVMPPDADFQRYRLVVGGDTVRLDEWVFEPSQDSVTVDADGAILVWTARRGSAEVRLTYTFRPDSYLFEVDGEVSGGGLERGLLLVSLGPRLGRTEVDSADNIRSFGIVTKQGSTDNLKFSSLDPFEREQLDGPFEWIAVKSKYFLAAILTIEPDAPRIGGAVAVGGPRAGNLATHADVSASIPVPGGTFSHSVYVGPQENRRLSAIGHDLEDVNPYGWILRPIIRPFAALISYILVWMHETLSLAYGWVLILFGVAIRVVLWPLWRKGMRNSMAMQAIQPEIKAVQQKYGKPKTAEQQQAMQREMMALYKKHGVNPLGGCLPMLLPMPILFALFFVFQHTIQFRGVNFMWLPDLSRPDPVYIIPFVMAASMYILMKLGQRGVPPNPQTKMMLYVMPGMFLFFGFQFPSGLNLYYAVSNIASLPQQWLISRERLRRQGKD